MKSKNNTKPSKREIVTVAEAKKSPKKRSTVAPNIQYDRTTQKFIVEFYKGIKDGKAEREHRTYDTFIEAKNALTKFKAEKLNGLPQNTNLKITFGDCLEEFISSSHIEQTTEIGYRTVQKRIQNTPLHNKKLVDVRKCDIEDYIKNIKCNYNLKNTTINKDLDLIQGTLNFAMCKEYINQNPATRVAKLKEEKFDIKPLEIEELKALQDLAVKTGDFRLIVPVYLGACQGLRRGEIVGLKWEMISFEDNVIHIRNTITQMGGKIIHKPPKTEESNRDLEMLPSVREILLECMEWQKENGIFSDYVVVNNRGLPINPTYLSKRFKEFLIENDFRPIRFHDLRHTFATCAISAGVNPLAVSGAMGHSNLSTTLNTYVHSKSLKGSKEVNDGLRKFFE